MSYPVVLLPRARQDLYRILSWLRGQSPQGAARLHHAFTIQLSKLSRNPDQFPIAYEGELLNLPIRQFLFKTRRGRTYRALFRIKDQTIEVLHVRAPG